MTRYNKRVQTLTVGLSALAGYVDAIGFVELGAFFVSFMSGNSTRLGVGLIERLQAAAVAGGLIATFVVGVIAGSLTARFARGHRRPLVLMLVAALLAVAAACSAIDPIPIGIAAMVLAMGADVASDNFIDGRDGSMA